MRTTTTKLARLLVLVIVMMGVSSAAYAQRTVTVHLNTATLPDTLRPIDEVQIRGCLEGCIGDQSTLPDDNVIAWDDSTTLIMESEGGDYWSLTFQIPEDITLNYKFYAQLAEDDGIGGWEDGGNHVIQAGTGDVERDLHFYVKGAEQAYDWRPYEDKEDSVAVWFRVYMNTESAVSKGYDPADENQRIGLRGAPEPGGTGAGGETIQWGGLVPLEQESDQQGQPGFHLYSGVLHYPAESVGDLQSFKYYIEGLDPADSGYEDGNDRSFIIPASDTTLHWVYFSNSPPVDEGAVRESANVIFTVDLAPLEAINIFERARGDTVIVRGDFNGFGNCLAGEEANPDDCMLFEQLDGTFSNQIPITAFTESNQRYKFFVDFAIEDEEHPLHPSNDAGWEEPLEFGGGNRSFTFTGDDLDLGIQYFNDIRPANVIPASETIEVTFRVDMTPALSFTTKPVFDPAADSVAVVFEDPIWIHTQERAHGAEELPEVILTDDDDDMIYEGTYTLIGPTYNGIGYRYEYGNTVDGFEMEGEGGFDAGRRRYQYVLPNEGGSWPSEYSLAVVDVQEFNPMPFEDNPALVSIEPVGNEVPKTITLSENYPNPFNPTTMFEYSIPAPQHVRVRVYDALGRVVSTLVDGVQPASSYRVTFDAEGLASGLYFYQLETPTQTISKKMILLK